MKPVEPGRYSNDWAFSISGIEPKVADLCDDRRYGVDYVVGGVKVAHRKRRFGVDQYGDIALRFRCWSGSKTEAQKIVDGSCQAHLYVVEFTDAFIVAPVAELRRVLLEGRYRVKRAEDSDMALIALQDIHHIRIKAD